MAGGDDVLLSPHGTVSGLPFLDLGTDAGLTEAVVTGSGWRGKRAVDLAVTVVLLFLLLPVFVLLAIAVKATSRGPVLFRQRRVGRGGRDFSILKFRTMQVDAERQLRADRDLHRLFVESGHKLPRHLDPRVTRVGRLLRRTSFDELPQLLNVVTGHMSLVGPRPVERTQLLRDYGGFESSYLSLRPGLTGLWQVSGRSTIQFPERAKLDEDYLTSCSPWIDAKILLRTPVVIVTGLGAD